MVFVRQVFYNAAFFLQRQKNGRDLWHQCISPVVWNWSVCPVGCQNNLILVFRSVPSHSHIYRFKAESLDSIVSCLICTFWALLMILDRSSWRILFSSGLEEETFKVGKGGKSINTVCRLIAKCYFTVHRWKEISTYKTSWSSEVEISVSYWQGNTYILK